MMLASLALGRTRSPASRARMRNRIGFTPWARFAHPRLISGAPFGGSRAERGWARDVRFAHPRLNSAARFAGSRAEWGWFHNVHSLALAQGRTRTTLPEPEARGHSSPQVLLIILDPVRLQKGDEFLLEGSPPMMLLLSLNVSSNASKLGSADSKRPITSLPSEM